MSSEQANRSTQRVAIIGAGPIGIEAALYAATLGHDVVVYDRGDLAQAVQSWGHVTLFSPWRMNTSPLGRAYLGQAGLSPVDSPADWERCPRGSDLFARYLLPLSQTPLLQGRLRLHQRVVAVGRPWLLKGEQIAKASRAEGGFQLLLQAEDASSGQPLGSPAAIAESVGHADVVLDCSGTYFQPNPIGAGGLPAIGERALADRILRQVPDILGRTRARFAGRRVLVIGGGHSAATAAVHLGELLSQGTQVIWAQREPAPLPFPAAVSDGEDPLLERRQLHLAANRLVEQAAIRYLAGTMVSSLQPLADGAILVTLVRGAAGSAAGDAGAAIQVIVDEVLGLTGYSPDRSIYEQLQIHECYASFGPMKLAAVLLGASGDCLAQPTPGPETLKNPEPNFFILGAKSYGRNSAFLLQIGHAQIRSVFQLLHAKPDLDLFASQPGAR
jgi:hypothetical protein